MPCVGVIDYGAGNIGSIVNMLKRIGVDTIVFSEPDNFRECTHLILPGVGAFGNAMSQLKKEGWVSALEDYTFNEKKPILGICLGMQVLLQSSEEADCDGLGWVDGQTVAFDPDKSDESLPIPHMGWNTVEVMQKNRLIVNDGTEHRYYFVHSFHVECDDKFVLARTDYGYQFISAIWHENIYGVQFHPEKSHQFGMQLLSNFVKVEA